MFPRRVYLLVLSLSACGLSLQKPQIHLSGSPCERLNIQVAQWDALNTRTLMSCLVNDSSWSTKVEALDPAQFAATARWLNNRPKLFEVANRFQNLDRDWGRLFQSPKTHETLSGSNLQSVLDFSKSVKTQWRGLFVKNEADYENLLEKIFALRLSRPELVTLLSSVGRIFHELPLDQSEGRHWAADLCEFMHKLDDEPAVAQALSRVAPHNRCTNLIDPLHFEVRTTSPLELGVLLFRDPSINPEAFVDTFEQGFLFWQSVCGGDPQISKTEVRNLLTTAVDNFDLLQRVASLPWSQDGIIALGHLLEINEIARSRSDRKDGSPPANILKVLLASPGLRELFNELQKDPARAATLVQNTPEDSTAFEVFSELGADPAFGPKRLFSLWMKNLDLLTALSSNPEVIREWQDVLKTLGPEATRGFGEAIQNGKFQERMKYLLYLMNLKQLAANSDTDSSAGTVSPGPAPKLPDAAISNGDSASFFAERAHRLIDRCLDPAMSSAQELECLKVEGSQVFPASARWLPNFSSDWNVLYLLRKFPMNFILDQRTAAEFWQPMLEGFHLPFKNADGVISWLSDGARLAEGDQKTLMNLGRKVFDALTQTPPTSSVKPLHKPDPAYFKVQSTLKTIDGKYFTQMIYSLVGDPKYLETRRSFYRLSQTKVKINGSTEMPILLAVNELIGTFKLPLFSHQHSLSFALSTAGDVQSPDDLKPWMQKTEKLLGYSDWWLDWVYGPDSEPRRSIHLAQDIYKALEEQADPKDLWNVFSWIRDFRLKGQWSQENLKFTLMLHEMGFLDSLQDLYDHPPAWLLQGIQPASTKNTQALKGISSWISDSLLVLFQGMDDQELYDFAVLNQEATNGKFLSGMMVELGELVVNPNFTLSENGQQWLLSGIRKMGAPPLRSPETITPLIKFVRDHKTEFDKLLQPEVLQLADELHRWKAYPELVDFLTSQQRVSEWHDLVEWLKSPIPLRLWNWSLRLERRTLDPSAPQNPLK